MIVNESEFIRIQGGNYQIGLPREVLDKASGALRDGTVKREFLESSVPEHAIHIDDVFIGKRLITCREFSMFAEDSWYLTEGEKQGWGWIWQDERWQKKTGVSWRCPFGNADDERYRTDDGAPVMQVSWNDAVAFCSWLAAQTGRIIRLPREAEWETFAGLCGVPGVREWVDGSFGPPAQALGPGAVREVHAEGVQGTGLLWEWTEDWYDRYPGGRDHKDFGTVYKVLRGGSALSLPVQKTREFRLRKCPTARSPYYGFRIACSANLR